jgi:hypothetical protein
VAVSAAPASEIESKQNEIELTITDPISPKVETNTKKWPKDIEEQLKSIEKNCSKMAQMNREEYLRLSQLIKYFKIPVIFFSGINSIFSFLLASYINQKTVSIISCILSFMVSLISSIELYLGLLKRIDTTLTSYKDFYLLSVKINNEIRLKPEHRTVDGQKFLLECLLHYKQLFMTAEVTWKNYEDALITNKQKKSKINEIMENPMLIMP